MVTNEAVQAMKRNTHEAGKNRLCVDCRHYESAENLAGAPSPHSCNHEKNQTVCLVLGTNSSRHDPHELRSAHHDSDGRAMCDAGGEWWESK